MININSHSNKPIYEQIVEGIKEKIIQGALKSEDKLPSVRDLAVTLSINPNTVSRAYLELESQGVIETFRGKGSYVAKKFKPEEKLVNRSKIKQNLKEIVVDAIFKGYDSKDIHEIINEIYMEIEKGDL